MWSLSPPLTSISKKGFLESVEWVWSLSHSTRQRKSDACRGQDSLSGAGSEETQNKWQTVFPVVKSVAPSCRLRLHQKDSVGPKITNRCNRVHRRENTCHLSSLRLLRSHKDLQGIYWMICNELDAENAEQTERNLDEVFFERGNKYAWDKCKNKEKH